MSKRLITILNYSFFLSLGLFLVWWQLRNMTPAEKLEFDNALNSADFRLIIPVTIMSLLSHISRSMRWKLLMEPLGYRPRLINVFSVTMIGYLANAAVPRLGELLKCTFLARYEKLKVNRLVGTIIVERSFDLVCYLVFIGITILLQVELIGNYLIKKIRFYSLERIYAMILQFVIIVVSIYVIYKLAKWLAATFPNSKFFVWMNGFLKGIAEGFYTIKNLKKRKAFLFHTIFIWSMYLGQIYVGFKGMDGTSGLPIYAAFSVLTLATLSMIVTPGGIGSFPIFVMQTLILYGIHAPLGKAFGWMMWGVSTGIILIVGLLALLTIQLFNRNTDRSDLA